MKTIDNTITVEVNSDVYGKGSATLSPSGRSGHMWTRTWQLWLDLSCGPVKEFGDVNEEHLLKVLQDGIDRYVGEHCRIQRYLLLLVAEKVREQLGG